MIEKQRIISLEFMLEYAFIISILTSNVRCSFEANKTCLLDVFTTISNLLHQILRILEYILLYDMDEKYQMKRNSTIEILI